MGYRWTRWWVGSADYEYLQYRYIVNTMIFFIINSAVEVIDDEKRLKLAELSIDDRMRAI